MKPGTPEFEAAMAAFRERMKHYRHERVYPTLPDWPVVCFYNMTKRRGEQRNWYTLPYEERRTLMAGHARSVASMPGRSSNSSPAPAGSTTRSGASRFSRTIPSRSKPSFTRCASMK